MNPSVGALRYNLLLLYRLFQVAKFRLVKKNTWIQIWYLQYAILPHCNS